MSKIAYFLDIDDCLIKTSRLTPLHLQSLKNSFQKLGIGKAGEITQEFASSFNRLFNQHQGIKMDQTDQKLLADWVKKAEILEAPIIRKYGQIKKWSREVCIYIAALKYSIKLSNSNLVYITNNLWSKISQSATFYPDTLPYLKSLQDKKIPIYLITSSDCRLTLDDKTGLFNYDPDYSRQIKLSRLKIFQDIGIPMKNIFIGDPYDKPNPWVFKEALYKARKDIGKKFISIMIGDSLKNDLLPAKKAGMDKLIWLKRDNLKVKKIVENITLIKSFTDLTI